jgi:uncharacterized protein (TIGR03546 family)
MVKVDIFKQSLVRSHILLFQQNAGQKAAQEVVLQHYNVCFKRHKLAKLRSSSGAHMTFLLKQLFAFLRLLNSDTDTKPLAAGLSMGLVLGFSPFLSLQTMIVLVLCLFFRIQLGAALLSAFFFKFVAFIFDPLTDIIGRWVLESETLRPTFISLYNMPVIPYTNFNNSIVMGSGLVGFILAIPMYFVFRILIIEYRLTVVQRIQGTQLWKAMRATKVFQWYATYNKLYQ